MYDFSCTAVLDLLHVRGYDLLVEEAALHIRDKDINKLARNHPVAVIIGAAGFIGSHLVDHLLKLKIQVIGVDDLSCGKVEYLDFASESEDFYFYHLKVEGEEVRNVLNQLPRLDYAFFVAQNENSATLLDAGLKNFLEVINFHREKQIANHHPDSQKPKILFLSAVELYDNKRLPSLERLETAEIFFAKYSKVNKLNARVVRLGEVFGPRMDLNQPEVFARLIKAALEDSLARENPTQDFSTRGIYIDDAVSLITKAMLLGASANKIFDGVQIVPLKVEEVKQVLLDPKWYQYSDFKFTELPPWETPNLRRTVKELSWKPRSNIIKSLKETLQYFVLHPSKTQPEVKPDYVKEVEIIQEKPHEIEQATVSGWSFKEMEEEKIEETPSEVSIWPIFKFLVIWVIILLGLVYPFFVLIAGNFIIPNSLKKAQAELVVGDFKSAEQEISLGYLSAKEQDNIISSMSFLKFISLFSPQIDKLIDLSRQDVESFQNVQQTINLVDKFVTNLEQGSMNPDSINQFNQSEIENEQNLANSLARVSSFDQAILGKVNQDSLQNFYNILIGTKQATQILPNLLTGQGSQTTKQYLVVLEDNKITRPTGGLISGLVLVKVGNGKVIDISTLSLDELDKKLPTNLIPDDLIRTSLNISNLKLSNSNFDADYPTFAKTAEALYSQAGGERVDGVIVIDSRAAWDLLESLGGVNLDSGDKITSKEEADALIIGSDPAKKSQLLKQILVKISGVSRQNIFEVGQKLSKFLNQKDILIFVNDSDLENKFVNSGWSGLLSGFKSSDNSISDVIAPVLYDFSDSPALKKEINDQVTINEQGAVQHNLTIAFTLQGDKVYSGELMVYLPVGVKINKVSLGGNDITGKVNPFIKYGLSGISLPLSIKPAENQNLILSYQLSSNLNVGQGSSTYKYNFIKQPGAESDSLTVTFNYPEDIKISDNLNPTNGVGGGQQIKTDLSIDRRFQLTFTK